MDYEELYRLFNQSRREELRLCEAALREAAELYAGILAADRQALGGAYTLSRFRCNRLCVTLNSLLEALRSLDGELEAAAMEPPGPPDFWCLLNREECL